MKKKKLKRNHAELHRLYKNQCMRVLKYRKRADSWEAEYWLLHRDYTDLQQAKSAALCRASGEHNFIAEQGGM